MVFRLAKGWHLAGLLSVAAFIGTSPAAAEVKNVIVMIADGSGFNAWQAASMYQGRWDAAKKKSTQVYDRPGWTAYACRTFPLTMSKTPTKTGVQDAALVYDPAKAWDRGHGYEWLKAHYTDSAAAATALSTGKKTFNHGINWSDQDQPLGPTLSEAAKAKGKCVGVITTVPWSHATPAGFSNAHVADRDNYVEIARQMLREGGMDVIMGAGNPDFDNNGRPFQEKPARAKSGKSAGGKPKAKEKAAKETDGKESSAKVYKYVGGPDVWRAIEAARAQPGAAYQGFRPVSTKAEFEALTRGATPAKVLGTAQVGETLQQSRAAGDSSDPARDTPLNAGLPDLPLLSQAALNVLDNRHHGFFLMIEGGAVDWANHRNQPGRMVQEQAEFVRTVEAVVAWVDAHSNWQETILVLTADHETGLLWGPESDTQPFAPIVDHGAGRMPGLKYHAKNHSNSLVPLYVRGAGSELFQGMIVGQDPVRGPYVDNTGVAKVLLNAAADAAVK